jgi:hypothetical protein
VYHFLGALPDLEWIVFDPTRLWVDLPVFALRCADQLTGMVE